MKKSTNYAPYIFALLINVVSTLTLKTWEKPGILLRSIVFFGLLVGMWRFIEW